MILCDSDILIHVSPKFPPAVKCYFGSDGAGRDGDEVVAPGVVLMELMEECRNKWELSQVRKLRSRIRLVWPEERALNYSVELLQMFHLSHGLRKYDALVAVTALSLKVPLHTFNIRHSRVVPGLATVQPYTKQVDR